MQVKDILHHDTFSCHCF